MNLAGAKIGQLLIPVEDFEKGIAFYRDVLGIPFLFSAPPQMAFFNCGGVRLLVGVMPAGQAAQRGLIRAVAHSGGSLATVSQNTFMASRVCINSCECTGLFTQQFTP